MSVPKKKSASRRKKLRASHHGLKKMKIISCPKCKKPILPHNVCQNCGYYKGKNVLNLDAKLDKKAKKVLDKKKEEKPTKKTK